MDGILRSQHTNAILVVVVSIYRVLWQVAAIAVFTVVCKRCRTTSRLWALLRALGGMELGTSTTGTLSAGLSNKVVC